MKNLPLFLIYFLASVSIIYFAAVGCRNKEAAPERVAEQRPTATAQGEPIDTIKILKQIKAAFCDTLTITSKLPMLDSAASLFVVNYYIQQHQRPKLRIERKEAEDEIDLYSGGAPEYVRTVWISIDDIKSLLGVSPGVQVNRHGYDGFRFYFAKNLRDTVHRREGTDVRIPRGTTTLVMVATKDSYRDQLDGLYFEGIYNKFDPCPPGSCIGTILRATH